jgi:hypothetical protein
MRRCTRLLLGSLLVAATATAQTPTGTLTGTVTDGAAALPGVTITVTSPNLQGARGAVTASNGAYLMPLLPPGLYQVTFELDGFLTVAAEVKLSAAQTQVLDAVMPAGATAEEITVMGNLESISTRSAAATTYDASFVDTLPVARDLRAAVELAPGVHATGPGGAITISGAQSYENLYMVNGVAANKGNSGNLAVPLFIEDAIQETTTTTSGVSAEYGRFAGGVVNMLTRSGGNELHGSFRASFDNETWQARYPVVRTVAEEQSDVTNTTYEATLGGFIFKDKLWFFGAGRSRRTTGSEVTAETGIHMPTSLDETRWEGKLTLSPTPNHRLVGSYMSLDYAWGNFVYLPASYPPVDATQFYDQSIPATLIALDYSGVLADNLFVEGQYSKRRGENVGSGGRSRDLIEGTPMYDNTNGYLGHAPLFCAVCSNAEAGNEDSLAKASYFLSSAKLGSHDIVVGYDRYKDTARLNNHQSGSDWIVSASVFGFDGPNWYPVFVGDGSADLDWYPILQSSKGSSFEVNSAFLNDKWQLNGHWSFNIGVRYDKNHGVNASGATVSRDSRWSPRLGVSWDPGGDGDWVVNASYAHYVTALAGTGNVADKTPAGAPATFIWLYGGPDINVERYETGSGPYLSPQEALQQVFDWFDNDYCDADGNCGISNLALLYQFEIPGMNRIIRGSLASPYAEEISFGFSKRLGPSGLLRMDYTRRRFKDLYETRVDHGTGTVDLTALGINWGAVDLGYIQNSHFLDRRYDGVTLQASYRFSDRLTAGGSYTWSHAYGNFDGEYPGTGPVPGTGTPSYYPEF